MATAAIKKAPILKAEQILAIPLDQPEKLFTKENLDTEFKALAKIWHPDRSKGAKASSVFTHISALHNQAESNLKAGIWNVPGLLRLAATNGKTYRIQYLKKHDFELGEVYVGKSLIIYCVKPEFKDLFQNAEQNIKGFKFADSKMEAEGKKFLPSIKASFATSDCHVLVLNKDKDFVLLKDLIDHVGGSVDPKHTAWMVNRLYNIACYLRWAGLTHNAISFDTVLIAPEQHTAVLSGGWWYARPINEKLSYVPTRTLTLLPPDVLAAKTTDSRVDLELIRAAGRELLGDLNGSTLKWKKDMPLPMAEWLNLPSSGDAIKDYRAWCEEVLPKSFGPKRFVPMNIRPEDVYPQP